MVVYFIVYCVGFIVLFVLMDCLLLWISNIVGGIVFLIGGFEFGFGLGD